MSEIDKLNKVVSSLKLDSKVAIYLMAEDYAGFTKYVCDSVDGDKSIALIPAYKRKVLVLLWVALNGKASNQGFNVHVRALANTYNWPWAKDYQRTKTINASRKTPATAVGTNESIVTCNAPPFRTERDAVTGKLKAFEVDMPETGLTILEEGTLRSLKAELEEGKRTNGPWPVGGTIGKTVQVQVSGGGGGGVSGPAAVYGKGGVNGGGCSDSLGEGHPKFLKFRPLDANTDGYFSTDAARQNAKRNRLAANYGGLDINKVDYAAAELRAVAERLQLGHFPELAIGKTGSSMLQRDNSYIIQTPKRMKDWYDTLYGEAAEATFYTDAGTPYTLEQASRALEQHIADLRAQLAETPTYWVSADTVHRDEYGHVSVKRGRMSSTSPSLQQLPKEKIMSNKAFQTINYVYGRDITTLNINELLSYIKQAKREKTNLLEAGVESKTIDGMVAELDVAIAKMTEALDVKA